MKKSNWPERWDERNGTIYYRPRPLERERFNNQYYFPLGDSEAEAFERWVEIENLREDSGRLRDNIPLGAPTIDWIKGPYFRARSNATKRGIEFTLTLDEAKQIADRSNGRCELSSIKFDFTHTQSVKNRRPYTPSLDRIDSTQGYCLENVRLILGALNIALGPWGESVFSHIVESYILTRVARKTENMLPIELIDQLEPKI